MVTVPQKQSENMEVLLLSLRKRLLTYTVANLCMIAFFAIFGISLQFLTSLYIILLYNVSLYTTYKKWI